MRLKKKFVVAQYWLSTSALHRIDSILVIFDLKSAFFETNDLKSKILTHTKVQRSQATLLSPVQGAASRRVSWPGTVAYIKGISLTS